MSDLADQNRGLYRKYELYRVYDDGAHGRWVREPFFVLRYTSDPHARAALEAYAGSCEAEYPLLAADLRQALVQQ